MLNFRRFLWLLVIGVGLSAIEAQAADGYIDQLRLGVLDHDVHFLGGRENGADLNLELQFVSPAPSSWAESLPAWLAWFARPRPQVGGDINTLGYTSQLYAGLTWTPLSFDSVIRPTDAVTFDLSIGPSFNDGHTNTTEPNRKALGSNVLARLAAEIGYHITPRIGVYVLYEHESNAGFFRRNESINNLGLRIGVQF